VSKKSRGYFRLPSVIAREQQVALRARIVLAAAQGHSNVRIADELGICVDTVRLWRDRWAGLQGIDLETVSLVERLQDAPRPGATPKFTTEQRCHLAALACEAPAKAGRPISQWTGREIADEMKIRGDARADFATTRGTSAEIGGLQPHRFRYWLTEVPDAQRDEKIREGCEVYASAAERATRGERTISVDELTGVQDLERKHPDLPMQPGHVALARIRVHSARNVVLVHQFRCRQRSGHRSLLGTNPQRGGCTCSRGPA
jgi:transposase